MKFKMPDVTPAQLLGLLTFIVSQAIAQGAITNSTGKLTLSIGGVVVAAAFKIADAVIRHGRANIAVAQIDAKTYHSA